jgi:hypothetical protein
VSDSANAPKPTGSPCKVRCVECGFLALRAQDGQIKETERQHREVWRLPPTVSGHDPFCFAGAMKFDEELKQAVGATVPEKYKVVFGKERECFDFREWQEGQNPQDHKAMLAQEISLKLQKEMQEKNQAWQEAQLRESRAWQEEQAKLNYEREENRRREDKKERMADKEEDEKKRKKERGKERRFQVFAIVLTGIVGFLSALALNQFTRKESETSPSTQSVPRTTQQDPSTNVGSSPPTTDKKP